jgi:hypothetical protein
LDVSDLLREAIETASKLPPEEQYRLAMLMLEALRDDEGRDRITALSGSRRHLRALAEKAAEEYGAGSKSDSDTDVLTLSDFQQNARQHIEQLRKSGRPELLTVDGKAELVVQHAVAYQKLVDLAANARAIVGIQWGLQGMYDGTGEEVDEVFAALERELGIPERE